MLQKFKKYPDYINNKVLNDLNEKGFSIYNYVSFEELVLTAIKDYLFVLGKINTILWIFVVIIGALSYYLKSIKLIFIGFLILGLVYIFIYLYVFIKLFFRTKLFIYVSDIVFTKKGLMISDDFLYYSKDREKISQKLKKYENIFLEYLSKPSGLQEFITKKKEKILGDSIDLGWGLAGKLIDNNSSFSSYSSRNNLGGIILAFIIFFSTLFYVASIYIFYYLGYIFLFIFSWIYVFILKIFLSLKDKVELQIKKKTLEIDEKLKKMNFIYQVLKNKIEEFKSGEISNIGDFVEDKFFDFYNQISLILKEQKELENIILNSKYSDFIDFKVFKKYLKKEFNKPVKDMISLLSQYEKLLNKQILELKKLNKNSKEQKFDIDNTEILDKNLEKKEFILNDKLRILRKNKKILEKVLI